VNDQQREKMIRLLSKAFDEAATRCTTADQAAIAIKARLETAGYQIVLRKTPRRNSVVEARRILGL
jgi:hypothetical protein